MMVVINLRDVPKSLKEMRKGGNQLHYEMIKFPLSDRFDLALKRLKGQLDEFK